LPEAERPILVADPVAAPRAAKFGLSTVVDFEKERRLVSEEAAKAIQTALQSRGRSLASKTAKTDMIVSLTILMSCGNSTSANGT
jgi:hypothetical protein